MTFNGIADAEQLAALTKLLDAYCRRAGVEGDQAARDRLAQRIMGLFNNGMLSPAEIERDLDSKPAFWQGDAR